MAGKIRIGALISGGGTNLQAIIDACEDGKIEGRMVFVGSDEPEASGLHRARNKNIPAFVVDYKSIQGDICEANPFFGSGRSGQRSIFSNNPCYCRSQAAGCDKALSL